VAQARENTKCDITSLDGGTVKQGEYSFTVAGMMRVELGSSGASFGKEG